MDFDFLGNQTIDGGWTTAQGVSTEKSLARNSSAGCFQRPMLILLQFI